LKIQCGASDWQAAAVRLRDPGLMDAKADPLIDLVRDDTRLKKIVESHDLPD